MLRFSIYANFDTDQLKTKALKYLDKVEKEHKGRAKNNDIDKNTLINIKYVRDVIKKNNLEVKTHPHTSLNLIRAAVILDDPTDHFPILSLLFKMGIIFNQGDIHWVNNSMPFTAVILQKYYDDKMEQEFQYKF